MADTLAGNCNTSLDIAANTRYILPQPDAVPPVSSSVFPSGGFTRRRVWATIQIDLNGGTCAYAFQTRTAGGGLAWQATLANLASSSTPASSGSTSEVFMFECTGKEVAVNVSGTSGAPKLSYCFSYSE